MASVHIQENQLHGAGSWWNQTASIFFDNSLTIVQYFQVVIIDSFDIIIICFSP